MYDVWSRRCDERVYGFALLWSWIRKDAAFLSSPHSCHAHYSYHCFLVWLPAWYFAGVFH